MNSSVTALLFSLATGLGLGMIFWGGLWLTVQHLSQYKYPTLMLALSFILRTVLAGAVFYWFRNTGWELLVANLAGFLSARILFTQAVKISHCN